MGRFSKLLEGKGKDVYIGDEKFNIKPLDAKYLGKLADADKSNNSDAMFELVTASLQQTDPEIKLEDVETLPIAYFNKVVEAVVEVNELDGE